MMRKLPFLIVFFVFSLLAPPAALARSSGYGRGTASEVIAVVGDSSPLSGNLSANYAQSEPTATAAESTASAPNLPATVTPQADGSILHIVGEGETLINIALAYNIPLKDLLEMNGLDTKSVIFPGEKLIIRKANTPTPTAAITDTPTPRPATPTRRPTRTPTPKPPTVTATILRTTPTTTPVPAQPMDIYGKILVGAIIAFGVIGVLLMVTGEVLKRKK
jgi:LysM repeat protein